MDGPWTTRRGRAEGTMGNGLSGREAIRAKQEGPETKVKWIGGVGGEGGEGGPTERAGRSALQVVSGVCSLK